jgi:FKBP-type peptidyl-prolyl cis-trans isomerase SlyD
MKAVTIVYELRLNNAKGDIIETVKEDKPCTFTIGNDSLLPKFEEQIKKLKTGDIFSFQLKCEDAYGMATEEAVADIPINVFEVDGKIDMDILQIGNAVPMLNDAGDELYGIVMEVNDTHVKIDFNHPLADEDLFFSGKIISSE